MKFINYAVISIFCCNLYANEKKNVEVNYSLIAQGFHKEIDGYRVLEATSPSMGNVDLVIEKGSLRAALSIAFESIGENSFLNFDFKNNNGIIEPKNSGRYITRIGRQRVINNNGTSAVIVPIKYIVGDGVKSAVNDYLICSMPRYEICAYITNNEPRFDGVILKITNALFFEISKKYGER